MYEDAPATRLLATHCACCARPLVDAKSVECGVGPECRRKHGFDIDVSEEARAEANRLVYHVAARQEGLDVLHACQRLRELGFERLAARIEQRCASVRIERDGDVLLVAAPYNEAAVEAWQRIPGRRWNRERKVNTVPASSRGFLWELLLAYFPGHHAVGPRGPFVVEAPARKAA